MIVDESGEKSNRLNRLLKCDIAEHKQQNIKKKFKLWEKV